MMTKEPGIILISFVNDSWFFVQSVSALTVPFSFVCHAQSASEVESKLERWTLLYNSADQSDQPRRVYLGTAHNSTQVYPRWHYSERKEALEWKLAIDAVNYRGGELRQPKAGRVRKPLTSIPSTAMSAYCVLTMEVTVNVVGYGGRLTMSWTSVLTDAMVHASVSVYKWYSMWAGNRHPRRTKMTSKPFSLFSTPSTRPASNISPRVFPGVTPASTTSLSKNLEDNHYRWHCFFNDKKFHKYIWLILPTLILSNIRLTAFLQSFSALATGHLVAWCFARRTRCGVRSWLLKTTQ